MSAAGLPLPLGEFSGDAQTTGRLAAKDRSRPIPCMNKPCGCRSARQCFTSCCCHTPTETLAWAKVRGLEPAVLAALASRVAAAAPARAPAGCCSSPVGCDDRDETATGSDPPAVDDTVCRDYQSLAADQVEQEADQIPPVSRGRHDHEPEPTDVVILRAMLACGGIVGQWTAVATSLPAPLPITCDLPWRRRDIPTPSRTVMIAEVRPVPYADHFTCHQWSKLKTAETAVAHDRHGTDANYLLIDGHVESQVIQETFDPGAARNLWNPSLAQ